MRQKDGVIKNGVLTEPMDTSTQDFTEFKNLLLGKAISQTEEQKLANKLMSLRIMLEDYLSADIKKDSIINLGDFLKVYLKSLNIKQNKFAAYVGLKPSNFSKILSNERKLNIEMALVLEKLFKTNAMTWISIQIKNELTISNNKSFSKYSISDLIDLNQK